MKRSSTSGAHAVGLRGGVDRDKNDVGRLDGALDVRREEKVAAAGGPDHLVQARLIDGQRVGIPFCDALGVHIDDAHLDVGGFQGDDVHRRTADKTSSNATDLHSKEGLPLARPHKKQAAIFTEPAI